MTCPPPWPVLLLRQDIWFVREARVGGHPRILSSTPQDLGGGGVVSLSRHQSNPSPSLETTEGRCPAIQLWAVKWESFEPKSWGQALPGTSPHLSETQFSLPRSRD